MEEFDSSRSELDEWLRAHALTSEARRTARTFVWHAGDLNVIAYYSLTAHLLQRADLPSAIGRDGPRQIPAVLLARLALDRSLHGLGLGGALLADALRRIVTATQTVAARFVTVDAIDDTAAHFYEHHGFRRIPDSLRLVQKLADIAAALES
ncbi:MAG: GNAT family N-acetyltransferase [Solirubrobacteraceae bacterium]